MIDGLIKSAKGKNESVVGHAHDVANANKINRLSISVDKLSSVIEGSLKSAQKIIEQQAGVIAKLRAELAKALERSRSEGLTSGGGPGGLPIIDHFDFGF